MKTEGAWSRRIAAFLLTVAMVFSLMPAFFAGSAGFAETETGPDPDEDRFAVGGMARYGVADKEKIERLYVLEAESLLKKDARIDAERIPHYTIWTNKATLNDIILLPNAARLFRDPLGRIQFVSDVLSGVSLDGRVFDMAVVTALNIGAIAAPVLSVGAESELNFDTGVFTIPRKSEFTLSLHEVSAAWLRDSLESGFIRTIMADPKDIAEYIFEGEDLPEGKVMEGLFADETPEGEKRYWIGRSPGNAENPDDPLYLITIDEETDRAEIFRLSPDIIKKNAEMIPVSLYLYRDSRSDRMEEEKYNVLFFDTPEGTDSFLHVITDVLAGRILEMPRTMRIRLRALRIEGADRSGYSISNHLFVLADGSDGEIRILNGMYQAGFDGNTFESGYTRVEGLSGGSPAVTVKAGQPVWPERTGPDTARDIGGTDYLFVDGEWSRATEPEPDSENAEENVSGGKTP